MKKNILFLTVCLICFASCTIEKRLYRPGWNINSSFTLKSGHSKNNISNNAEEDIQNQNSSETCNGSIAIHHETKPDGAPQIIHIETSHSDEAHMKEDHFINREISNSLKASYKPNINSVEIKNVEKFNHFKTNFSQEKLQNQKDQIENKKNITKTLKLNSPFTAIQKKTEINQLFDPIECDIIVCNNGDEIQAKVLEIGTKEIKYKRCDNQNGPIISIPNSSVLMIKYPNGTKDLISVNKNAVDKQKSSAYSIASLICGILSVITVFGSLIFGVLALISSDLAFKEIEKEDVNYKKSSIKMAKAGKILGIIGLILTGIFIFIIIL